MALKYKIVAERLARKKPSGLFVRDIVNDTVL
jgi:hypothetical protein